MNAKIDLTTFEFIRYSSIDFAIRQIIGLQLQKWMGCTFLPFHLTLWSCDNQSRSGKAKAKSSHNHNLKYIVDMGLVENNRNLREIVELLLNFWGIFRCDNQTRNCRSRKKYFSIAAPVGPLAIPELLDPPTSHL